MKNYLIRKELRDMTPEQREQWRAERRAGTRRGQAYDAAARKIAEGYEAQGVEPELAAELGASPAKRKAYEAERKAQLAAWRADHPHEETVNSLSRFTAIPEIKFGKLAGRDIAGAQATFLDRTNRRHTLTRVVTVAGAFTKKKTGYGLLTVLFADGTSWTHRVNKENVDRAARWAAAFSTYADTLTT